MSAILATRPDRFSRSDPCPICGGDPTQPRGSGAHCYGYYTADRRGAVCTHEEYGGRPLQSGMGFWHALEDRSARPPVELKPQPVKPSKPRRIHHAIPPSILCDGDSYVRVAGHDRTWQRSDGSELCTEVRYAHATRKNCHGKPAKEPRVFTPVPAASGGGWRMEWPPEAERTLYHLPELVAPIYITEGPKCADLVRDQGALATCALGGAGGWLAMPEAARHDPLRARHVVILADAGADGERFAAIVAADLAGIAASVKVILLGGLADGQDIEEWLALPGNSWERLQAIVQATPTLELPGGKPFDFSAEEDTAEPPATQVQEPDTQLLEALEYDQRVNAALGIPDRVARVVRVLRPLYGWPYRQDANPWVDTDLEATRKKLGKSKQAASNAISLGCEIGMLEKRLDPRSFERTDRETGEIQTIRYTVLQTRRGPQWATPEAIPAIEKRGGAGRGQGRKCKDCGGTNLRIVCADCGTSEPYSEQDPETSTQETPSGKPFDSPVLPPVDTEAIKPFTTAPDPTACPECGCADLWWWQGRLYCQECSAIVAEREEVKVSA